MKKINLFNRNTNLPSYRGTGPRKNVPSFRRNAESPRCCRELVCGKTDGIPLFSGMTVRICGMMIAITALFATPSFATDPDPVAQKTVASKAYVDTKQDIIETELVDYHDAEEDFDYTVPALVSYGTGTNNADGVLGNKIGILGLHENLGGLGSWEFHNLWDDSEAAYLDNFVPTVRAVAVRLQDIWESMSWTSLTWDSAETTSTNAYETKFVGDTGATANAWPSADRSKLINTAALAQGLALKQNKITTGLVTFREPEENIDYTVPALVSYGTGTNNADGVLGNKIGILGIDQNRGGLGSWEFLDLFDESEAAYLDNFVPTVRAVAGELENIRSNMPYWSALTWGSAETTSTNVYETKFVGDTGATANAWPSADKTKLINTAAFAQGLALKQNKLPAKSTGNAAPRGNQAVVLNTAGNPSNVYTTAGKDLALTAKSGAQKVMNYIDGTTASATFATSQGLTEAKVKSALVSLELLKDVYGELNAKITDNALPTGTTGTVVTYNGTNATTGVQEFGERAVYDPANTYNASTDATKLATMASVKYVCGGYEPAAAGQPAHDGTHPGDEDYCWLWALPN